MKALEVSGLEKKIGKLEIVRGISFDVDCGEIVAFVGPNGAGKSTTFKLLLNLIYPTAGTISIMGHDLEKERSLALRSVAAMIEEPSLYMHLSGRENLKMMKTLFRADQALYDEVVEHIEMGSALKRKVSEYSLGMKQRLMLGMVLMSDPKVLLLDEPFNGLDPKSSLHFREILRRLAKEKGTAILVSSHILQDLDKTADRAIFIQEGRLIEKLPEETIEAAYARLFL